MSATTTGREIVGTLSERMFTAASGDEALDSRDVKAIGYILEAVAFAPNVRDMHLQILRTLRREMPDAVAAVDAE